MGTYFVELPEGSRYVIHAFVFLEFDVDVRRDADGTDLISPML